MRVAFLAAMLIVTSACSGPTPRPQPPAGPTAFPTGELVDLSHTYDATTIFWPTADPFTLEKVADGDHAGRVSTTRRTISRTAEHGGTHLDAPVHFAARQTRPSITIPLDQLIGPAVVVDVTRQVRRERRLSGERRATSKPWERTHGPIPAGSILLIRTGFSKRWPDAAAVPRHGRARRERPCAKLHFPGLHPDAARMARGEPFDQGAGHRHGEHRLRTVDRSIEAHRVAVRNATFPAFENLTALDRLPRRGAYVVALPMKIGGGSGAPLRAIAVLP